MASRAEAKAKARAERLAQEEAAAAAKGRRQRLGIIGGVVAAAVVVVVVLVVISSSGSKTVGSTSGTAATAAATRVDTLLKGIPEESDNVLGNANAPITITEYGDLECSICDELVLPTDVDASNGSAGSGIDDEIIDKLVKTGKAKLVYDSLDTATSNGVTPGMFTTQQAAAYSAGLQDKGWYYLELFYNEQGKEGSDYVTQSYLDSLAKQVPGLNYKKWLTDLKDPTLTDQVSSENSKGTTLDLNEESALNLPADERGASTPTLVVSGKKGSQTLEPGLPTYSEVTQAIALVQ